MPEDNGRIRTIITGKCIVIYNTSRLLNSYKLDTTLWRDCSLHASFMSADNLYTISRQGCNACKVCQSCYKIVTAYFFFMGCLFSFWSKCYKNSLGTVVILPFACCTIKPGKITSEAHYKTVRDGNWLGI